MRPSHALIGLLFIASIYLTARSVRAELPIAPAPRVAPTAEQIAEGRKLFLKLQCAECHTGAVKAHAPQLVGLIGTTVTLNDGTTLVADEAYVRESILKPRARVVKGWKPIMPTYEIVTAEELDALVVYLRRMKVADTPAVKDMPPVGPPTEHPKK